MFYIFSKSDFSDINFARKVLLFFGSYALIVLCILVSLLLIASADYFVVNVLKYESIVNLISVSTKEIGKENILKIVIIVPVIEEILFRLILKPQKFYVGIFTLFFSFYLLNGNFTNANFTEPIFYLKLSIAIVISTIIYLKGNFYVSFIKKNKTYFIVLSIMIFGLAHISNIKPFHLQLILFYPIFVIPQIIIGYFITNIRLKLGFLWGILLHCFVNLINIYL